MKDFFVAAINTDSGKTLVSAILCEALQADYWKPVQAGAPYDKDTVKELLTNSVSKIHPETYLLETPESPHAAAGRQGIEIELNRIKLPSSDNAIIVEAAGGCLVPLNESDFVIDIATQLKLPLIVVSNFYLGSINHTLLTIEAIRKRGLYIEGIIFNGVKNVQSENIILKHTGLNILLHIEEEQVVDKKTILKYASQLRETWNIGINRI
jgi:dethiobiotin synthetase